VLWRRLVGEGALSGDRDGACPGELRGEKWGGCAHATVPKTASGVLGEEPLADGTKRVREFGKIDL